MISAPVTHTECCCSFVSSVLKVTCGEIVEVWAKLMWCIQICHQRSGRSVMLEWELQDIENTAKKQTNNATNVAIGEAKAEI